MRVLLVAENTAVSGRVRSALLGGTGHEIVQVATPQRALHVLDEGEERFDLVVADNDTTPTGGFFLARELTHRTDTGYEMPPIVLMVARDDDKYLATWAGADAFVRKPVDPFDLAEVCECLADGRPVPALPGVGRQPDVSTKGFGVPEGETAGAPLQSGGP